ncbi:hypothetical protein NC651_040006 [Populus alba x Populus x berolinensis]|nr:hypothetical protein NC651_040006 [Populus alba x Populus x berolinensis]
MDSQPRPLHLTAGKKLVSKSKINLKKRSSSTCKES